MLDVRHAVRKSRAFISVVRNPGQLDRIIDLVDAVYASPETTRKMVEGMSRDPELARALRDRPRLGVVDMNALGRLPEGTLGRAFADTLRKYNLDQNALPQYEAHDAASYIKAHMLETHDLWHLVTGFNPDPAGELGLQSFYFAQSESRASMSILLAGIACTFLNEFEICVVAMPQIVRGWLLGRRARRLFGTDWNRLMDRPIEEVRATLNLDLARVDELLREYHRPRPGAPVAQA